jgi:hypothetical protein
MCHILLNHGFDCEEEDTWYGLENFRIQSECLWEEEELADVISRDPRLAEHICARPSDLGYCGNPRIISLIIAMNHRFAGVLGKDYDDPTASLNVVLSRPLTDAECAKIVRQLFALGAEMTEAMRARYAQWHPGHGEVLQALDEALSVPDVKEPAE